MRKVMILLALIALIATPVLAKQAVSVDTKVANTIVDRDDVELGYDDGVFSGYGTSPDWTDMTLGVYEVPAGNWTLTTFRAFYFGNYDNEILMDDTADFTTAPAAPYGTGLVINPGTEVFDDSDWVDVNMAGLGLIFNGGDMIAIGLAFTGNEGVGLSDCTAGVDCGYYWASYGGAWGLDADYGKNNGLRVVLTGGTASDAVSLSAVKALY